MRIQALAGFRRGSTGRCVHPRWRSGLSQAPRGFSLIELLITVSVAAIMAAIALPSFREFIARQSTIEITNELVASLNTARIEAVKRGASVAIKPDAGGWTSGWTVSADVARDGKFLTPISSHSPIKETYTIEAAASNGGDNAQLVFGADGTLRPAMSLYDFNVCRPASIANAAQSRRITVGSGGAVSSRRDVSGSPAGSCG